MRRLLPAAVVVLLGCPPGFSAPECDTADGERYVRFDPASSPESPPPDDEELTGWFLDWGPGQQVFETEDGARFGFELVVDGSLTIPALAIEEGEPVTLTVWGFNPAPGDQSEPLFRVASTDGDTLLLAGNVELVDAVDGWTVRSPRDEQTCQPDMEDGGPQRYKPVFVARGGDETTLFAGDERVVDGMRCTVIAAESNNRNHPFAPCSDEDCPWEKLAWWVVPVGG